MKWVVVGLMGLAALSPVAQAWAMTDLDKNPGVPVPLPLITSAVNSLASAPPTSAVPSRAPPSVPAQPITVPTSSPVDTEQVVGDAVASLVPSGAPAPTEDAAPTPPPAIDEAASEAPPAPAELAGPGQALDPEEFTPLEVGSDPCLPETGAWGPVLPLPLVGLPTPHAWTLRSDALGCQAIPDTPAPKEEATQTVGASTTAPPAVQNSDWLPLIFATVALASGLAVLVWNLYGRVTPQKALKHPNRASIVAAVKAAPGLELAEVSRRVGLSESATSHHVRILVGFRFLDLERVNGRTILMPADPRLRGAAAPLRVLQRPHLARIHAMLAEKPGLTQNEIAQRMGVRQQSVSKALARLVSVGLVEPRTEARPASYDALAPRVPASA